MKAVCHIHSDWSYDGHWKLADLARAFGDRGCRVVLLTEHDRGFTPERWRDYRVACGQASTDQVLLVPGLEYSDAENIVHILVWGSLPFLGEALPTSELLLRVKAQNGVAVMAHPSRRVAWRHYDPAWADVLTGIELWNRKTDGWAPSRQTPALLQRSRLHAFAGLDFHDRRQFFPLHLELDLAGDVSELSVVESLRNHRCRATAFGRPVESFCESPAGVVVGIAEQARRRLARLLKGANAAQSPPAVAAVHPPSQ